MFEIAEDKEVAAIGANGLTHLFYFIHEPLSSPQTAIGRLVAIIRAELIVFVELKSFTLKKGFKTLHVFVSHGRATMKQQYFDA